MKGSEEDYTCYNEWCSVCFSTVSDGNVLQSHSFSYFILVSQCLKGMKHDYVSFTNVS